MELDASKKGKKRKAEDDDPTPDDPSAPKKKKPATKVTKGRAKGPVDLDKQCGVINDKGLPCSRSLTCKSHSMGAKRAVLGRSKPYDELLLEWNRLNNPNFVEPVKRETKAERKERKEKERKRKEEKEANMHKRLLKLISPVVVRTMSRYRARMDVDVFKKHAKEVRSLLR